MTAAVESGEQSVELLSPNSECGPCQAHAADAAFINRQSQSHRKHAGEEPSGQNFQAASRNNKTNHPDGGLMKNIEGQDSFRGTASRGVIKTQEVDSQAHDIEQPGPGAQAPEDLEYQKSGGIAGGPLPLADKAGRAGKRQAKKARDRIHSELRNVSATRGRRVAQILIFSVCVQQS